MRSCSRTVPMTFHLNQQVLIRSHLSQENLARIRRTVISALPTSRFYPQCGKETGCGAGETAQG